MTWQPTTLWEALEDSSDGNYHWRKEERDFANCYVCYYKYKEIGFIPVQYDPMDREWCNWWDAAYKRHEHVTLNILKDEIVQRHQKRRGEL